MTNPQGPLPQLLPYAVAVSASNQYAGSVASVHDGDTVHVQVLDPLLSVPVVLAVRILGINTAELSEPGGVEAHAALAGALVPGTLVTLDGVKPDKYAGRVVAGITTKTGVSVAAWLIARGLAVPWNGSGPKPPVPWPPTPGEWTV